MAKIKFSALVSEMRNKLNGSVLSKNRYGNYVRNKVTPVNPQTSFQQAARSILASLSQQWRGLTQAQRNSWIALANTLPFTDIFGDLKYLTGSSLYVKLNANLLKTGASEVAAAPIAVSIPTFDINNLTGAQTAGALTNLTIAPAPDVIPSGFVVAVYATPPSPASQLFIKNKLRFIGTVTSTVGGEASILTMFTDRYGTAALAGQRITVRTALVSQNTGQQGIPTEASIILA
jgi:hypothetical protein